MVWAGKGAVAGTERKICVITGSRADYGLLKMPMRAVQDAPSLALQVLVTGAHYTADYGESWKAIAGDGFDIDAAVPISDAITGNLDMARASAAVLQGVAEALDRLRPDLVLLLGDRYEILAAATAACLLNIPLGHLCGGDLTTGAVDDVLRHSISKMAQLHFPSNEEAARRLLQMGEPEDRVFTIGSPGLDAITSARFADRVAVFDRLGLPESEHLYLVTLHPETRSDLPVSRQIEVLQKALCGLDPEVALVLTGSNADAGGAEISDAMREFAPSRPRTIFSQNLGQEMYLDVLHQAEMVIGNSSSGLYEAPSFGIPTVNIGERQGDRLKARSVVDCEADAAAIRRAIARAADMDCRDIVNPYGDGHASSRLVRILQDIPDFRALLRKTFVDRPVS